MNNNKQLSININDFWLILVEFSLYMLEGVGAVCSVAEGEVMATCTFVCGIKGRNPTTNVPY